MNAFSENIRPRKTNAPCIASMLESAQKAISEENPSFAQMCMEMGISPPEFMAFVGVLGEGINYIYQHPDYKQSAPDAISFSREQEPIIEIRFRVDADENRVTPLILNISGGYVNRYFATLDHNVTDIKLTVTGELPLTPQNALRLQAVEEGYHTYQLRHMPQFKGKQDSRAPSEEEHDNHPMEKDALPVVRQAAVNLGIAPTNFWPGIQKQSRIVE